MFLLDTTTVSEMNQPRPNPGVDQWFQNIDWTDLHLSVISVAELWRGITKLPNGPKRRSLEAWFDSLRTLFAGRILPVDFSVAIRFGEIQAAYGPLPAMDTLIAATALTHRLTLVSRNTKDVGRTGAAILDPWT
jgi:predicted nucleic acid-binding protein